METSGNEKNERFFCQKCDYKCQFVSDWSRHVLTRKHIGQSQMETNGNEWKREKREPPTLSCETCAKLFSSHSGLWKHSKKCVGTKISTSVKEQAQSITDKDELILFLIKECTDYKNMMMEQQTVMMKVMEHGVGHSSHNNNSFNNNNNTFNLQVFLNETCKDAMNLMDFVDSIKLQLSDLEKFAEVGYIEGISNIITTNLKAMDVTQRPVHCTDKKRETMYVKNENQWIKEDDNKSQLRKAIKRVSNKNIRLLPQFREKYPDYSNASSKMSDTYDKMVIEVMTTDVEKENKILRNISSVTLIDKHLANTT